MEFAFSPPAQRLREEVAAVLDSEWEPGHRGYRIAETAHDYTEQKQRRARLARYGWFGLGIPEDYGGTGGGVEERYVVAAEFSYRGIPYPKVALNIVAPTLLAHASEELKRSLLPAIARGELEFALGYSEPEAGSDLAALRTTAVRDGDEYVVNGQKLYTSFMHRSEYCLIAARTDPSSKGGKGISLLLIDVDAPGISTQPLWGMGDIRSNITFWEDVRVPAGNLIGAEGDGWSYIRTALNFERLVAFPLENMWGIFEDLVDFARGPEGGDEPAAGTDPVVRQTLADLAIRLRALETLTLRNLWYLEVGRRLPYESSQIKVLASELRRDLADAALEIIGPEAQVVSPDPQAPLEGGMFRASEGAAMQIFGAGANEIQRDLIASHGMGLPRG